MAGLPGARLPRLRQLLARQPVVRVLETHSGLSGLIAETVRSVPIGKTEPAEFDALWSSSLTASASKGLPDIETVDTTARLGLVKDTLAVTSKPMIYDGDTGGLPEIFQYTVRSLESLGVSACIIEDKKGLKQNSLFGTDRKQQLDTIEDFTAKLAAGQEAKQTEEFMLIARIEALIAGYGLEEALTRAKAYSEVADGIMIHSKDKDPAEVFAFLERYNALPNAKPVVVVPTTYNHVTEDEFAKRGVKIVIYANHLLRGAYPTMKTVAENILKHQRSYECDNMILGVKPIIGLIDSNPLFGSKDKKPAAVKKPVEKAEADPAGCLDAFVKSAVDAKVGFCAGVPDSLLSSLQVALEKSMPVETAANEGAAVAMAAGHYFATSKVPLVYLQNSGLGNIVNPVMSLCHQEVYGVPMVLVIGWRGAPGHKDEPQHVVQGRQTVDMLEAMGVPHFVCPSDPAGTAKAVKEAVERAEKLGSPVALLVPPKTFPGKTVQASAGVTFAREDALRIILEELPGVPFVGTTGFPSREIFELRKERKESHGQDFLSVGSMGHAVAIAQGLARGSARRVACIDGDGASLMHLGSAVLSRGSPNLTHILLNNDAHDSVGGQPTAPVDFTSVMGTLGYQSARASNPDELRSALRSYQPGDKPWFLEVKVGRRTRSDLGRPTHTTQKAKEMFMEFVQGS